MVDDCGEWDADSTNDCALSGSRSGEWACPSQTGSLDVYELLIPGDAEVVLDLDTLTGGSAVRFGVYASGTESMGANHRNSDTRAGEGTGAGEAVTSTFVAATEGVYTVVVGRDWDASVGSTGTYDFHLEADALITPLGLLSDDQLSTVGLDVVVDVTGSSMAQIAGVHPIRVTPDNNARASRVSTCSS